MKGFCENCRDVVGVTEKIIDKEKAIKGRLIKYKGKAAFCDECGSEVFVPEIRDHNLSELDNAYRKAENLIKVEDMEKILDKYDIGKRPLSKLLGWGEVTLTRYVDGDIPSKPYSDTLKHILEDSGYYLEILEGNKSCISDVAYRKSRAAVERITAEAGNEAGKLELTTMYLLQQASEITPLALQKLLYYAQGFRKAFTGIFMFEEDCEAWVHGPVFRNVYEKYKNHGYNPIETEELYPGEIDLPADEKELLDHIVLYFGCYSGKVLENMTHSEEPWQTARHGLKDGENSGRIIEKERISSYFSSVKVKYNMLNFADMKDYSKDLFNKLYY